MPLTEFQREVCRLIAVNRRASGESYVAGGAAISELLTTPRLSRDVDVFSDTQEALQASWERDRELLLRAGYSVMPLREHRTFVEAEIRRKGEVATFEWAQDSAFRFFPLMEHPDFGLTLHPFDLATNKALALVGRLEVRDWVDLMDCSTVIQPLGYLAWAACGKDPGLSPAMLLSYAGRARYSGPEVAELSFDGPVPDAGALSQEWRRMLVAAKEIVALLPAHTAGTCVLRRSGELFQGDASALAAALAEDVLSYHAGRIRGALPFPADIPHLAAN